MTTAEEMWLPVLGYEGAYEVSNIGRVRSWKAPGRSSARATEPRLLVQTPNRKRGGYMHVGLCKAGDRVSIRPVHAIVLETFAGPRPAGAVCRHLNGRPADNRLCNLKWGTQAENMADAVAHGTATIGPRNAMASLSPDQVLDIRRLLRGGAGTVAVARRFCVSNATISRIKHGCRYASV